MLYAPYVASPYVSEVLNAHQQGHGLFCNDLLLHSYERSEIKLNDSYQRRMRKTCKDVARVYLPLYALKP